VNRGPRSHNKTTIAPSHGHFLQPGPALVETAFQTSRPDRADAKVIPRWLSLRFRRQMWSIDTSSGPYGDRAKVLYSRDKWLRKSPTTTFTPPKPRWPALIAVLPYRSVLCLPKADRLPRLGLSRDRHRALIPPFITQAKKYAPINRILGFAVQGSHAGMIASVVLLIRDLIVPTRSAARVLSFRRPFVDRPVFLRLLGKRGVLSGRRAGTRGVTLSTHAL